jgi:hypothetical protein
VGRGVWRLKEWYPNRSFKKDAKDTGDTGNKEDEKANAATTAPEPLAKRKRAAPPE